MTGSNSVMEDAPPPGWIRPNDVMRVRKLRAKRHALQSRMGGYLRSTHAPSETKECESSQKKHNPFRQSPRKNNNSKVASSGSELSSDVTLFNLLYNPHAPRRLQSNKSEDHYFNSFSQALRQQGITANLQQNIENVTWNHHLPVDWSLKTSIRFISDQKLPWKSIFKMSEEASGTTGMVRCIWNSSNTHNSNSSHTELDTSPNAEFYQRCLVWQHPSLPGVTLYPRFCGQRIAQYRGTQLSSVNTSCGPYAEPVLAQALHSSWCDALRSLHQLLRVRQCPYFYVCAPTYTVLYRAAGVCSIPNAHALLTPTTRGLRRALREEGIDYKMPFCKERSTDCSNSSSRGLTKSSDEASDEEAPQETVREEDEDEATSFLEHLGVDASQFTNINASKSTESSGDIDRSPLSLVYIADPDTQALTNFLLNSSSCTQGTGPLAGVPPTLLAPVAFQGGTLLSLKTKGSVVRMRGEQHHSMEVTGPILPHTPLQLCRLLSSLLSSFNMTASSVTCTTVFSNLARHDLAVDVMTKAFAEEGLVDCGLESNVKSLICQPLPDSRSKDGNGSDESERAATLPSTYRKVLFKDGKYTWTDSVSE